MDTERRKPKEIKHIEFVKQLNPAQSQTLQTIESFGWNLEFVRRPLHETPVPVVVGEGGEKIAVIEEDGYFNVNADIHIRHDSEGS